MVGGRRDRGAARKPNLTAAAVALHHEPLRALEFSVEPALLARKQKNAFDGWLATLKEKAKIKKYLDGA